MPCTNTRRTVDDRNNCILHNTVLSSTLELTAYLRRLAQCELIQFISLERLIKRIEQGAVINVYCGYELSGDAHLGTFLTYALLLQLSRFPACRVYGLLADYHTSLNDKPCSGQLETVFHTLAQRRGSPVILLKNHDDGRGYIHQSRFHRLVESVGKRITIGHIKKASRFFKRDAWTTMRMAQANYVLYQVTDMEYLSIDLAIGGTDQRKIHMLHHDRVRKASYLHMPLLETAPGVKMSKSLPETVINIMDPALNERLSGLYDLEVFKSLIWVISGMTMERYLQLLLSKPD